MNKEFIKGQLKGALSWLNTSNTNKNVLHAKDSINMALKELDDLKIYKKDINKFMPILKAFAEGRTIQFAVNGDSWIDIDSNEEGLFIDTLMATPRRYRIKPEEVEHINKEYISGDFVYIHGSLRIINNCDGYYATYYDEEETLQEVNVDVIEGVLITPEILEKNGWDKDEERSFKTQLYYKKKFGVKTIFVIVREEGSIVVCDKVRLRIIKYIHELQHLFFGLDISHEMKV